MSRRGLRNHHALSRTHPFTGCPFVDIGAGTLGRCIALMWLTWRDHQPIRHQCYIPRCSQGLYRRGPRWRHRLSDSSPDRAKVIKDVWIIVEAIPEILTAKIRLFSELGKVLPNDCIMATNSSSSTSSEMAAQVSYRARFFPLTATCPTLQVSLFSSLPHCHVHPSFPALPSSPALPLPHAPLDPVKVMPNPSTDLAVVALLLRELPKHSLSPYHVRTECVGLIFNCIWAAIKHEALLVVAEPTEVDVLMHKVLGGIIGCVRPDRWVG
ncbi:hypothetical protein FIBSPDRAFT_957472 [Athelia psychrophila]|uniref:3-hydroxyacyl-CoA dehydrogenase NAD binding domain-containing protein n=1 Tax=Athelia psychrophila TaxID=1759441 RepID=A0A166FTC0_9AGAM|nr:hypothetical protein FIBSPDRAFT_957472 [Fibularhizoctonia sp. CBS 109695]